MLQETSFDLLGVVSTALMVMLIVYPRIKEAAWRIVVRHNARTFIVQPVAG